MQFLARPWFWVVAIGALFAFPLGRSLLSPQPKFPPRLGAVKFTLVDENGKSFSSEQLAGKVWVASVQVSSDTPALEVMHKLERKMRKLAEAFHLISVSTSSPTDLKRYAEANKVNWRRWNFLSGDIATATQQLHLDAAPDNTLALVDQRGELRGTYTPEKLDQLVYDAAVLVNGY
jgi:cytochrome oxidase Cu insertion factor (SCO1/SenC/PrrC family)